MPEGQVLNQVVFALPLLEIKKTLKSFINNIITFSRKTWYLDIHFKILTKTPQFAKQIENSFSSAIGAGVTL